MRYLVKTSFIHVIGTIWMPAVTCAYSYELRGYDIENMRNEDGTITRESISSWLTKLMELIEGDVRTRFDDEREDVTVAGYRAALRPIKAFRTRQGAGFAILDA